jgi:hypothetical protein
MVPEMVETYMADFIGGSFAIPLFGESLEVSIRPTQVDVTPIGASLAIDCGMSVTGAYSPGYLSTPEPRPAWSELDTSQEGFRLAVADDTLNQALTAFWSSGALALDFPLGDDQSETLIGSLVSRITLDPLLPPVAFADRLTGDVSITVGDMIIDVIADNGAVVTRFALSAEIELGVAVEEGEMRLSTTAPTLWVDLLDEGVEGANVLNHDVVEVLVSQAAENLTAVVDDMLGALPIPALGGTTMTPGSFAAQRGYVLLGGSLVPAP